MSRLRAGFKNGECMTSWVQIQSTTALSQCDVTAPARAGQATIMVNSHVADSELGR